MTYFNFIVSISTIRSIGLPMDIRLSLSHSRCRRRLFAVMTKRTKYKGWKHRSVSNCQSEVNGHHSKISFKQNFPWWKDCVIAFRYREPLPCLVLWHSIRRSHNHISYSHQERVLQGNQENYILSVQKEEEINIINGIQIVKVSFNATIIRIDIV